jgi:hypothetical protein
MVVIAKGTRLPWPSRTEVAMRQARIRASWSPWERRERAREAQAQARFLWALVRADDGENAAP